MEDDQVFVMAPAAYAYLQCRRASERAVAKFHNCAINEAMAARDLIRWNKQANEFEVIGESSELERYGRCRDHLDEAVRECGMSVERLRWIAAKDCTETEDADDDA